MMKRFMLKVLCLTLLSMAMNIAVAQHVVNAVEPGCDGDLPALPVIQEPEEGRFGPLIFSKFYLEMDYMISYYDFTRLVVLDFPDVKNYGGDYYILEALDQSVTDSQWTVIPADAKSIYSRNATQLKIKGEKAYFIAIPMSSGTGSEVTPFAVITDQTTGTKYPLADYELLPNMAIIDTDLMMSAPKGLTAASGYDAMVHALEAYASVMATDYTDGLAIRAMQLIFQNLPTAYNDGTNVRAREKMATASTMAGMAFANAFLGVCHSMAHKLGAYHHLPHGVANALLLTIVMRYNASEKPRKMGTFSQYQYPHTLERYVECAEACGVTGANKEEIFEKFLAKLEALRDAVGIKPTIRDYGIDEQKFLDNLDQMSEDAFDDQCTGANPRYPLISEIREMYLEAYYGEKK